MEWTGCGARSLQEARRYVSKQQVARTELRGMGGGCSDLDRNVIAQFPSIRIFNRGYLSGRSPE